MLKPIANLSVASLAVASMLVICLGLPVIKHSLAQTASVPHGNSDRPDSTAAPQPNDVTGENPHWTDHGCRACHTDRAQPPARIAAGDADLICLGCHDGKKARAEAHPIGLGFDAPYVSLPSDWPTEEGRLSCVTCHDVFLACDLADGKPHDNPSFLRDYRDGDAMEFCANCHDQSAYTRQNPHLMLDADGDPSAQACARCHDSNLSVDQLMDGQASLRGSELELCGSCHARHLDYFDPGHTGAHITALQSYLGSGPAGPLRGGGLTNGRSEAQAGSGMLEQVGSGPAGLPQYPDSAHRVLATLPLQNGTIVCSTCHNPHQVGLFNNESARAAGAMHASRWQMERMKIETIQRRSGGPVPLRLPIQELCIACHGP